MGCSDALAQKSEYIGRIIDSQDQKGIIGARIGCLVSVDGIKQIKDLNEASEEEGKFTV